MSAELHVLSSELASQGPKVSRVLGSEFTQQCVDHVCRVLPVIQAALTSRERQLRDEQQQSAERQVRAPPSRTGPVPCSPSVRIFSDATTHILYSVLTNADGDVVHQKQC